MTVAIAEELGGRIDNTEGDQGSDGSDSDDEIALFALPPTCSARIKQADREHRLFRVPARCVIVLVYGRTS